MSRDLWDLTAQLVEAPGPDYRDTVEPYDDGDRFDPSEDSFRPTTDGQDFLADLMRACRRSG